MKPIDVIVIAGKTVDSSFLSYAPDGYKSLININGRPAVSYLVDSLKRCEQVSRVVLISDRAAFDAVSNVDEYVELDGSETESMLAGIGAVKDADRCLIMGADMPLASPEAITDLLAFAPDSDIVYPVVEKSDVKKAFPDRTAYYVQTKEGKFTGSSCLLFRPAIALSRKELLASLIESRKNPAALMKIIGPGIAFKLMFSTLGLPDFEQYLSHAAGLDCRVFVSRYPELFVSIDSMEDIKLIERELLT